MNVLLMIISGCDFWMQVISVLILEIQPWFFYVIGYGWIPCMNFDDRHSVYVQ